MELTKNEIDTRLYMAAKHLLAAGELLDILMPSASERFILTAKEMLDKIEIEEQIITNEKISSILDEIFEGCE